MPNDDTRKPVMADGLEINAVDDGFVIYQPAFERVHYLNHTAGILLEFCNGRHADADLPDVLQRAYDLDAPPRAEVEACLRNLREQGLIR
jgi:hypothetical protein